MEVKGDAISYWFFDFKCTKWIIQFTPRPWKIFPHLIPKAQKRPSNEAVKFILGSRSLFFSEAFFFFASAGAPVDLSSTNREVNWILTMFNLFGIVCEAVK